MQGSLDTPRIFISYSWTNPPHELWVKEFAQRLTGDGIYVVLDKWDLKEGQDKHKFMEKMVIDSQISKVLVICDAAYQAKANERKGGVGTESQLISKEVYENTEQEKFIPIVKEYKEGKACIPSFMASRIYIDLSNPETYETEYEKLLRNIYGKPEIKRPPLGSIPEYILDQDENPSEAVQQFQKTKLELLAKPVVKPSGNIEDFLESFFKDLEKHRLTGGNKTDFDEQVIKSISELKKLRDVFVDFTVQIFRHSESVDLDTYKTFFERSLTLLENPVNIQHWTEVDFDNFKFLLYELFLYFIAVLLKERKFKEASYFINGTYFFRHNGELIYKGISTFNTYPISLEEIRNQRLKLRRVSIVADLIKERAQRTDIDFGLIKEVDLILYTLTSLNANDPYQIWFPRTSVYGSMFRNGIELFEKMVSKSHFEKIKILFKVSSKEELLSKIANYIQRVEQGMDRRMHRWDYHIPMVEKVINWKDVASIE